VNTVLFFHWWIVRCIRVVANWHFRRPN